MPTLSPTPTQARYAGYMLASIAHAEPGKRIYCGSNAKLVDPNAGCVSDGEIIASPSTYPKWYSILCELGENGGAIRRNLSIIAAGRANERGGKVTQGYRRVLKQVQIVVENGAGDGLIPPDDDLDPDALAAQGFSPEAVQSCREYLAALAEEAAQALEEVPVYVELRGELPEVCAAQVPSLAPYASRVKFWGTFPWIDPRDDTAAATLRNAGYRIEVKTGRFYGPPYLARRLPVRPCHVMPEVSYRPYAV